MSEINDPVADKFVSELMDLDPSEENASTLIKNLKNYAEARKLLQPEPTPEPEPTGAKAFFKKHAGDLIKVGGTLGAIGLISLVEARGNVIFRSKAAKYI